MADLIVKRATARRDLLRRYAIEIDGESVAYVRAGGTTHVTIAEGMREVRMSIDGYSSKTKTILASNQCVAILNCAPAEFRAPSKQSRASFVRLAERLPQDRTSYIGVDLNVRAIWQGHFCMPLGQLPAIKSKSEQSPVSARGMGSLPAIFLCFIMGAASLMQIWSPPLVRRMIAFGVSCSV